MCRRGRERERKRERGRKGEREREREIERERERGRERGESYMHVQVRMCVHSVNSLALSDHHQVLRAAELGVYIPFSP